MAGSRPNRSRARASSYTKIPTPGPCSQLDADTATCRHYRFTHPRPLRVLTGFPFLHFPTVGRERIAWIPRHPAKKAEGASADLAGPAEGVPEGSGLVGGHFDEYGKTLPAGWVSSESQSQPGTVVYENARTGERIAWVPTRAASAEEGQSPDLAGPAAASTAPKKTLAELLAEPLPDGWEASESGSRPGSVSYENARTGERIAWKPTRAASAEEGASPDIVDPPEPDADSEAAAAAAGSGGGGGPSLAERLLAPLPRGWLASESASRPGSLSYENEYTGERIAWTPTRAASSVEGASPDIVDPSDAAVDAAAAPAAAPAPLTRAQQAAAVREAVGKSVAELLAEPLPSGWLASASVSRPGTVSYENAVTGERIAWKPTRAASMEAGRSPDVLDPDPGSVVAMERAEAAASAAVAGTNISPNTPRGVQGQQQKEELADYGGLTPEAEIRARLTAFYATHNPEKLTDIPSLVSKYRGNEEEMFRVLARKYGARVPTYAALTGNEPDVGKPKSFFELDSDEGGELEDYNGNPLPRGWRSVESGSHEGEVVYENLWTKERIAWIPRRPASKRPDESPDLDPNAGLPAGWTATASESSPGMLEYENVYTQERVAWVPTRAAAMQKGKSPDLRAPTFDHDGDATKTALARLLAEPVPDGWRVVESSSRPGEVSYENVWTEERIVWRPTRPASTIEGESPDLFADGGEDGGGGAGGGGAGPSTAGLDPAQKAAVEAQAAAVAAGAGRASRGWAPNTGPPRPVNVSRSTFTHWS